MKHIKLFEQFIDEAAIRWQDAKEGDSALVKDLNKLGLIVKAYGRKFHLKFPDGSDKTYDASDLEFITNEGVSEAESYKLGDKWSHDFDYEGMLQIGTKVSIKTPIRDLKELYKSMVDVNYNAEARRIDAAIWALDSGDKTTAAKELKELNKLCKQALEESLQGVSEAKSYKLGDKWSRDFDYKGMLQVGTEVSIKTPIHDLKGLYKSMVDVNYHAEARYIDAAIEALDSGDKTTAAKELKELNKLCKQALEESLHESKSEAELVKKANQFKKELMQLKKDPKGNELRIAAKEEQLTRVAQAIRNTRADKMGEAVTEAKDLRSLQKTLDKLQNDYEGVLDDETLDAMSELIMTVNSKL